MKASKPKQTAAGMATGKLISLVAGIAAVTGIVGGIVGPPIIDKIKGGSAPNGEVTVDDANGPQPIGQQGPAKGFTMGTVEGAQPIESISVTITVAGDGGDLDEQLNLDLGTGFPFRLYPLGW